MDANVMAATLSALAWCIKHRATIEFREDLEVAGHVMTYVRVGEDEASAQSFRMAVERLRQELG